jgi:autotransporter-associated beta strand protein
VKKSTAIAAAAIAWGWGLGLTHQGAVQAQETTVFNDSFGTTQGATYTTSGAIGTSPWSVTRPNADWGARIDSGILDLTNDASATANSNGWVYASVPTSGFISPWNSTLSSNPGLVTWDFNMRQIRPAPSGFSSGSYGAAFILGSTSTTAGTAGNGYAVVLGNGGAPDPIRLVSFTNGIQSLGTGTGGLISAPSPLNDPGASYMSLRVTYDPVTNGWALFGRNDGTTAFANPAVGPLSSLGTATNSTYTGVPLTSMGGYWNGSTGATQTAFFDNVSVKVAQAAGVSSLYWDGVAGWASTSPGSGGSGTWTTGAGGWDSSRKAVFAATGGNVTVDAGGVTAANGIDFESTSYTLAGGPIAFGATANAISVSPGAAATINSVLTGSNGISKTLAGSLVLNGENTFSGVVTISGGSLAIAGDTALGVTANDVVVNGTLRTATTISLDAGRDVSGAGTLDIAPGTTLTVNGATSMTGLTLANAGTLSLQGAGRSVGSLTINAPAQLLAAGTVDATGITAAGLNAGTATINAALTLTAGDKTVDVPGTGRLVLQGDVSGLGTSRLIKTGTGTLEVSGQLAGGLRVGVAGSVNGGTVVLGQAGSAGSTTQLQLNYGTIRTDAVGGLAMTPGLSIGGRDAARAVLGSGQPMSYGGSITFFGSGVLADVVLEVNNQTTFGGAVTLAPSSSVSGWTIRGTGGLTLAGASPSLTAPLTLADSLTLMVTGTTANDVNVGSNNILKGTGAIAGAIAGAGSVQPGTSSGPGILTAGQLNPAAGTNFMLKFTGAAPNYASATASVNDVVRVTGATPLTAAMTSASDIDLFFGVTTISAGNSFEGGFFTDTAADFASLIAPATVNYYVLGNGAGTDATLAGQGYYSFTNWKTSSGADPLLSLNLATTARTANFTGTDVNGQAMIVTAVPEPSATVLGLAAAGLLAVGLFRRRSTGERHPTAAG